MIFYSPPQSLQTPEIMDVWYTLQRNEEYWITAIRRHVTAMSVDKYRDASALDPYFQAIAKIWKHTMRKNAHLLEYDPRMQAHRRIILPASDEISWHGTSISIGRRC